MPVALNIAPGTRTVQPGAPMPTGPTKPATVAPATPGPFAGLAGGLVNNAQNTIQNAAGALGPTQATTNAFTDLANGLIGNAQGVVNGATAALAPPNPPPAAALPPLGSIPDPGQDPNNLAVPGAAEGAEKNPAFSTPGLGPAWAAANLPGLQQPGVFENFWNGISGAFNANPNTTNQAEAAYQDYLKNRPNIQNDPNLGAYYSDAEKRATDTLNAQAASRGNYGSSVALGEVGKAIGGLEADRAQKEAAYQLQKDAEQRQWQALGGTLGSSSDVSNQRNIDAVRQWLSTGGTLAGAAQDAGLSRIMGGGQLANLADTQKLQQAVAQVQASNISEQDKNARIQELYNMAMGPYQALSTMAGNTYQNMIGNDIPLFGEQVGAPVAAAGQAANAQTQVQAQDIGLAQLIANFLKGQGNTGGGGAATGAGGGATGTAA